MYMSMGLGKCYSCYPEVKFYYAPHLLADKSYDEQAVAYCDESINSLQEVIDNLIKTREELLSCPERDLTILSLAAQCSTRIASLSHQIYWWQNKRAEHSK